TLWITDGKRRIVVRANRVPYETPYRLACLYPSARIRSRTSAAFSSELKAFRITPDFTRRSWQARKACNCNFSDAALLKFISRVLYCSCSVSGHLSEGVE